MSTYYASPTGNDTTGDGSAGNPWKTVNKGVTTIATDAEHTLKLAAGTYHENTSSAGYLNIIKARTEWLTIESASGDADDVIITGTSGGTYNILFGVGTTAKIKFSKVTLTNWANTSQYVVAFHANSVVNNVTFDSCKFIINVGGNNNTKIGLLALPADTKTVEDIIVNNCTFTEVGTKGASETVKAVSMSRTAAGATLDDITFTSNTVVGQHFGVSFTATTGLVCTGNTIQAGTGVAVTVGSDDGTGNQAADGTVASNRIKSGSSHGLLIGNGCDGVSAYGNRVIGGDYGIVIKNAANITVKGNLVSGPSTMYSAIYIKASNAAKVYGNLGMCCKSGGWVLRVGEDSANSTLYQAASVYGNTFIARNGAHLYYWGPDAEETGETSVCNYNTLVQAGSGNYGTIKDTADVATLAAVSTAWSGYDVTTNDNNSVDGALEWFVATGAVGGSGMGL